MSTVWIVFSAGEFGVIYDLQVFSSRSLAKSYIRSRANPGDYRLECRNIR